jgi:hypothetical protein
MLLPAMRALRTAEARMSQRIALLRTLEALRMHAAANAGKLPASLEQVTLVPIPVDPVSGKAFSYRLENNVAYLAGEPVVGWHAKYEIRLGMK